MVWLNTGREWLVERGAGGHREETWGCSVEARRIGRGEEALALHGRGVLKVTMNESNICISRTLNVYVDDSSWLFTFANSLCLHPLIEMWLIAQTIVFQVLCNQIWESLEIHLRFAHSTLPKLSFRLNFRIHLRCFKLIFISGSEEWERSRFETSHTFKDSCWRLQGWGGKGN